jgi:transcriptional regulator with GAF, ATPase, and Fis domain
LAHAAANGPRFLVVYAPGRPPTRHVLPLGRVVVGRASSSDIVVDDDTISRQHLALLVEPAQVLVEDLGSANGTSVGGIALGPAACVAVSVGGMLAFGDVVALLRTGPDEASEGSLSDAPASSSHLVELIAPTTLPVLILGETGVGKEVVAERIVAGSTRSAAPFVRINCAALTEALFESELFGHERGAFTSAAHAKKGLLETADGGTVLLDEIGDLPLAAQAKLLRVLESGEIARVGAVRPRRVDVRFLAATNRDLAAMVEGGSFRADLLYRLDGVTLRVPPLRDRVAEIPTLARTLLEAACRASGRSIVPTLTDGALSLLVRHDWPGNVRELRRVMERVAALCPAESVRESDVRTLLTSATAKRESRAPTSLPQEVKVEVESIERARIEEALRRAAGNQTQAAKVLGISRRTLIDRMERFGMPRPRKA